jgi:glucose/arabinose dehydrogenase
MIPRLPRSFRALALVAVVAIVAGCAGPGPTPSGVPASSAPSAGGSGSSAAASDVPATASPSSPTGPFDPARVGLALEPVVDGLDSPLAVTHAGDGSGRLFVAEQEGAIRIVRDGSLVDEPFLEISERISAGGERGLLGLAFHPDFPSDPRVFVNYTDTNGDTRISSFALDPANPDRGDPGSEVRLMFIEQPYANHNGGALVFGPDGFLYIATGDGGSGGDPHGNGQSLETHLGKILRIDVDRTEGDRTYAIPTDNPFVGRGGALPEIFVYGMRNPWRMSFDRATRDLWIGDVGQGAWEEIDVVRAGTSGQNFGWNRMEGAHCFRPAEACEDPSFVLPVTEYTRDLGTTIIGGGVYRGVEESALVGGYVFADFNSGNVWLIDPATDGPTEPVLALEADARISSFGEDEAGEIYATDLSSGELLRVRAVAR